MSTENSHTRKIRRVIEDIERMRKVMAEDGAWDSSDYSTGFYNGIEFCYAIILQRQPRLRSRRSEIIERDSATVRLLDSFDLGGLSKTELIDKLITLYKKDRVEN